MTQFVQNVFSDHSVDKITDQDSIQFGPTLSVVRSVESQFLLRDLLLQVANAEEFLVLNHVADLEGRGSVRVWNQAVGYVSFSSASQVCIRILANYREVTTLAPSAGHGRNNCAPQDIREP